MTIYFIAFGSWKIRHNEPLAPADHLLVLCPLRTGIGDPGYSTVLDLSTDLEPQKAFTLHPSGERENLATWTIDALAETTIPLAILASEGEYMHITHGVMRIDLDSVQFMQMLPDYQEQPEKPLWQRIYDFNADFHLFFANHECFYIDGKIATELEQKFHFPARYSYWRICQTLYAAASRGDLQGFRIKYSREFKSWSFDNYLYEILPNAQGHQGYVSMIHYCKKKKSWDDPLLMYKKKLYGEDALERWEKNYENQWVDRDKKALLQEYFGYELSALPPWRRTRCDVALESIATGNTFMVTLDDCHILASSSPKNELQQCEIEYTNTRGFPDQESIYQDFEKLVTQVSLFLKTLGLEPTETYYSKLTWLREVVASERTG